MRMRHQEVNERLKNCGPYTISLGFPCGSATTTSRIALRWHLTEILPGRYLVNTAPSCRLLAEFALVWHLAEMLLSRHLVNAAPDRRLARAGPGRRLAEMGRGRRLAEVARIQRPAIAEVAPGLDVLAALAIPVPFVVHLGAVQLGRVDYVTDRDGVVGGGVDSCGCGRGGPWRRSGRRRCRRLLGRRKDDLVGVRRRQPAGSARRRTAGRGAEIGPRRRLLGRRRRRSRLGPIRWERIRQLRNGWPPAKGRGRAGFGGGGRTEYGPLVDGARCGRIRTSAWHVGGVLPFGGLRLFEDGRAFLAALSDVVGRRIGLGASNCGTGERSYYNH